MKHTGKSSVGRLWASRRGWDFYDLDALLEAQAGGRTSRQIYTEEGKSGFQIHEAAAARSIAGRLTLGGAVLAWGGGTITNPEAVETLKAVGTLVVLTDQAEVLYKRILRGGRPAFLSESSPWEDFQALYRDRTVLLRALCPRWLDLAGLTIEQACDQLDQIWNTSPETGGS